MLAGGVVLQNRYRIETVLGRGGMGAVYLAIDGSLGNKRVAIKEMSVLIDDAQARQKAIEQFQVEARMLAELDHPGLVRVSHYFEEQGMQYLVMMYIDGSTLEAKVNERSDFWPLGMVLDWTEQLADVLDYLHNHQPPIIFRDLKPPNVMIDARNHVILIDFG
ncbi:MAG TPA: serine/threonine-protein kinase, partial [Candidatus Xenobia bacterium]